MKTNEPTISVLVVDDSAANRKSIAQLLDATPGLRVVDRAADGEEGLRKAMTLKPDVITLDLEMPKLDGHGFLRLLMANAPTPVVVLSSYNHPADVFKALQLGAVDFVAKPRGSDRQSLNSLHAELVEKVRAARGARGKTLGPGPKAPRAPSDPLLGSVRPVVVAIGASTGGPPAVQRLLEAIDGLPVCALVAQHMPARFTAAFAARLDAVLTARVSEATSGDRLEPAHVYIAPGGAHLEVVEANGTAVLHVSKAQDRDWHAPSVDRLFLSVAKVVGSASAGVVLTGMGDDGAVGVKALRRVGAEVWAEAQSSAVVFGMPQAAIATGAVRHTLPIGELGPALARALRKPRGLP